MASFIMVSTITHAEYSIFNIKIIILSNNLGHLLVNKINPALFSVP